MKRTLVAASVAVVIGGAFLSGEAYADRQSKMHNALDHLQSAQSLLQDASRDKGGHRARAMKFVQNAILEVKAGIAYDNHH
jgi:hypothetical protein